MNPCWHLKGKVGSWDRISGGVVLTGLNSKKEITGSLRAGCL